MLSRLFLDGTTAGERPALVGHQEEATWNQLAEWTRRQCTQLAPLTGKRIGIQLSPTSGAFAALAALDQLGCDAFLFDGQLDGEGVRHLGQVLKLGAVLQQDLGKKGSATQDVWAVRRLPNSEPGSGHSSVTILTSGTAGLPKAVRHTWDSLARPVRSTRPQRWLLTYRPHLYAGLQVALQCFVNRGVLVVPPPNATPDEIVRCMRDHHVDCASATPSYWRRLVLFADQKALREVKLNQITLGGEVVDQPILDSLRALFRRARIAHIYATTEMGRCFSVTDGVAGFPREFLDRDTADGVRLSVRDGELWVRSSNAMQSYDRHASTSVDERASADAGWFATGDLVEIQQDRVFFVGRRTDMINVGGNKVAPLEVERVIREVPGVADVRVFAKESSIAGQLVACEVVPCGGHTESELRQAIASTCASRLSTHQRPRFIDCVESIQLSGAGKMARNPATN